MAGNFNIVAEISFTSSDLIVVPHGGNRAFVAVRLIVDAEVRRDLIESISQSSTDPLNELTIKLTSPQTGVVQVIDLDFLEGNLASQSELVAVSGSLSKALVGGTGITVTSGTNTITIASTAGSSKVGQIYTAAFGSAGTVGNKWLEAAHSNPSNQAPLVISYDSDLVAITYTNESQNVDVDIEIYSVPIGSGSGPSTFKFDWELRDVRIAKNTSVSGVSFNTGDKVGIFVEDNGTNSSSPEVTLYLRITADDSEDILENYSGNMSR